MWREIVYTFVTRHNDKLYIDYCVLLVITNPSALVQTDVNGAFELHVGRLRELERPEFRSQEIAVHRVEVFEQIRVDRTAGNKNIRKLYDLVDESENPCLLRT